MFQLRTLVLCTGLMLLMGCGGLSVRHLPSNQWKGETSQTLPMRYLSFQYQVVPVGGEVGVMAEAYPVINKLPDWASWYGEIVLNVYIADATGKVLASQENILVPRSLNREAGLPVEATFELGTGRQQPLFVSFGYRLVLTDAQNAETRKVMIMEGALEE
ncbi:MAG: hypothetical protein RRY20_06600 [Bilophila sp.]